MKQMKDPAVHRRRIFRKYRATRVEMSRYRVMDPELTAMKERAHALASSLCLVDMVVEDLNPYRRTLLSEIYRSVTNVRTISRSDVFARIDALDDLVAKMDAYASVYGGMA